MLNYGESYGEYHWYHDHDGELVWFTGLIAGELKTGNCCNYFPSNGHQVNHMVKNGE